MYIAGLCVCFVLESEQWTDRYAVSLSQYNEAELTNAHFNGNYTMKQMLQK